MVSVGAGAVLVGLVSAFPQLVWLSEHKALVFGLAGALIAVSGVMIWRARRLPCPVDPVAARSCMRLRRLGEGLYYISLVCYLAGAIFAFALPALSR
jgi:uncharacterized iron-regulated membrane protein